MKLKIGGFYKTEAKKFPTIIEVVNVLSSTEFTVRVEMCFWYQTDKGILYKINEDPVIDIITKDSYSKWEQINF